MKPLFQEILASELDERRARNRRYSMRAYARDLGLSVSQLSEVLSGKRGLTEENAKRIARRLPLSLAERTRFELSVKAHSHPSENVRRSASEKLEKERSRARLSEETFSVISNWSHFAILEYLRVKPTKREELSEMSEALRLKPDACRAAVERLIGLKLITICDGIMTDSFNNLRIEGDVPSVAIRKYHHQLIELAQNAVDSVPLEERELQSLTISIPLTEIESLKKMIREFQESVERKLESATKRDRVYAMNIQLFPLSHPVSGEESR